MTRGALTTFSIANDVAKYFAIIPAAFVGTYPALAALNIMPSLPTTILAIEDETPIRRFLRAYLEGRGFTLLEATTGAQGLTLAASHNPSVILLDLGLPDIDGLAVLSRLREWTQTPIIILSARGQENDKIAGLDGGADDYLVKPFSVGELEARIRVALRHTAQSGAGEEEAAFTSGDLRVDFAARKVMGVGWLDEGKQCDAPGIAAGDRIQQGVAVVAHGSDNDFAVGHGLQRGLGLDRIDRVGGPDGQSIFGECQSVARTEHHADPAKAADPQVAPDDEAIFPPARRRIEAGVRSGQRAFGKPWQREGGEGRQFQGRHVAAGSRHRGMACIPVWLVYVKRKHSLLLENAWEDAAMAIQYQIDEQGNRVAVVIPLAEWEAIQERMDKAGPRTCESIRADFGTYCAACAARVKSPIVLGRVDRLPEGFQERKNGIYYRTEDKDGNPEWHWVCSPLKVLALTCNDDGLAWGRYVAVLTPKGVWNRWAMPKSLMGGSGDAYRAELLDMGLDIAPGKGKQRLETLLSLWHPRSCPLR